MTEPVVLPPEGVYYVEVDGVRQRVVVRWETVERITLRAEKQAIIARLQALPAAPTNAQLLAWAKENYPFMNYEAERQALLARLAEINELLGAGG